MVFSPSFEMKVFVDVPWVNKPIMSVTTVKPTIELIAALVEDSQLTMEEPLNFQFPMIIKEIIKNKTTIFRGKINFSRWRFPKTTWVIMPKLITIATIRKLTE